MSGFSVRFVPPTASTHGELAGQDTCGFLSDEVSLLGRHAARARGRAGVAGGDDHRDPERRLGRDSRARPACATPSTGDTSDSHSPYETETTLGSGVPLVVACRGAASSFRKPRTSPSSDVLVDRMHPEVEAVELRRDHRDDHRVERALEDRLDPRAVVDLQRRSLRAEAVAELVHVRGRRGRLADDREPRRPDRAGRRPAAARSRMRPGSGSGTGRRTSASAPG